MNRLGRSQQTPLIGSGTSLSWRLRNSAFCVNPRLEQLGAGVIESGHVSLVDRQDPYPEMGRSLEKFIGPMANIGIARVLTDEQLEAVVGETLPILQRAEARRRVSMANKIIVGGVKQDKLVEEVDLNDLPFGCDEMGLREAVSLLAEGALSGFMDFNIEGVMVVGTDPAEFVKEDGVVKLPYAAATDTSAAKELELGFVEPGLVEPVVLRPYGFTIVSHTVLNSTW